MSEQRNLKIRRIDQLISSNRRLNKLHKHAKDICALNKKLSNYLTPTLSRHCTIANYANETLIINTDTSAWASKLRHRIPDILDFARQECRLSELISIRIKVVPDYSNISPSILPTHKGHTKKIILSQRSATFIRHVATSIKEPALREALLKISKNAE